jgi:hypothetical protein
MLSYTPDDHVRILKYKAGKKSPFQWPKYANEIQAKAELLLSLLRLSLTALPVLSPTIFFSLGMASWLNTCDCSGLRGRKLVDVHLQK